MIEEFVKSFLSDLVGGSLRGLFRRAGSRPAFRFKLAGWVCVVASIAIACLAARFPRLIPPRHAVAMGTSTVFASLGLGLAAAVVNDRIGKNAGESAS